MPVTTTRLADYAPYPFEVTKTDFIIQVFDDYTQVQSTLAFKRKSDRQADQLVLNYKDMDILALSVDGVETSYECEGEVLRFAAPEADEFVVRIENRIDPVANTSCAGFYANEARDLLSTQCEPEDFRRITPYPDRPDVLSIFTVRIEADKARYPTLLCNGNPQEAGDLADGRHFAVWHDPHPKPCYLFALVVGDLVVAEKAAFTTMEGRKVDLSIYTRTPDANQCAFAMDSLKRSMKWDEDTYGRAYDLDVFNIVAVHDFNMGAMENKGLNIFNTKLVLARPELTTDAEYAAIDRVIGHEYFHNWSGDRVTCRDWFQISLKEGFTVFRENGYGKDSYNREVERIGEVRMLKGHQFVEDAGATAHPVQPKEYMEINNFYTLTVYEKGGEVIGMYKTLMGDCAFRQGTDLYFERHDGQAVTIEDFLVCMEEASGRDLHSQFRRWYDQAGTPVVHAHGAYDAATSSYALTLAQEVPYGGQPLLIPVAVGLVGRDGADVPLTPEGYTTRVLELSEAKQTFTFEGIADSQVVPSILRDFSAPVRLVTDLSQDDLRFLLVHDSDGVNKWEAAQSLYINAFERCMDALKNDYTMPDEDDLVEAVGGMLANLKDTNPALLAELLALPDDGLLVEHFKPANPAYLQQIKEHLSVRIGGGLLAELKSAYEGCAPQDDAFALDNANMARRALRNACLELIVAGDAALGADLAKAQYEHAPTMTERLGALKAINDTQSPVRVDLLADFYARFKDYPLVIDRWFSLQATAKRAGVVDDVLGLMGHGAFTMSNPNRVRSLVGAFGTNMPNFHRTDGAGYKLMADFVLKMDAKNEQVAARLLTPFKALKSYDEALHAPMRAALQSVLDAPGERSAGVYEIITKALEA